MAGHSAYIERELSWLEFNQRVLDEACDTDNPLMERLKFLAITASNLDEFTMVRVGSLNRRIAGEAEEGDDEDRSPVRRLRLVLQRMHAFVREQHACLAALEHDLARHGVRRLRFDQLNPEQSRHVADVFAHDIFPLLTPIAVPSIEKFPALPGSAQCMAVRLAGGTPGRSRHPLAVMAMPRAASRLISLPGADRYSFILLEDILQAYADHCFPGERIVETAMFRITRNADLEVQEEMADDFLAAMGDILVQRRDSPCVRLELRQPVSAILSRLLQQVTGAARQATFLVPGPLALDGLFALGTDSRFAHLQHTPWDPQPSPALIPGESMFTAIARRDVLLSHPYESFEPVLRLINEAADDPLVLAIKIILYRTSANSPIIAALRRAAGQGKQVTALVELKARFSEARNIGDARLLEMAGVQVLYGIKGLKTHAKVCLIVRREPNGIRRYMHFGTGNYNEVTARLYTDVSYLTCNEDLAADASLFFNTITGYAQPVRFRKLEAAPLGLRDRLLELIAAETLRARQGEKGRIIAKINSLVDRRIIDALYDASRAGVKVRLIVRGICCLRPGVPGMSDNIKVISIVDRFLEHSRILWFRHGGEPQVFIGSADWMARNLDRRIELLVPVEDPTACARLRDLLDTCWEDAVKARCLGTDGVYRKPGRKAQGDHPIGSQEELCRAARRRARRAAYDRRRQFEPHLPVADPRAT